MLKITALKDIQIAVNRVMPQVDEVIRGVSLQRQEVATIRMKQGEERQDVFLVFGFVPQGLVISNRDDAIQLGDLIPHPGTKGEVVEFEGKIRLEML